MAHNPPANNVDRVPARNKQRLKLAKLAQARLVRHFAIPTAEVDIDFDGAGETGDSISTHVRIDGNGGRLSDADFIIGFHKLTHEPRTE